VTPSSRHLILFTSSLSLRVYELPSSPQAKLVQPIRVVARSHDAPVHVCTADPTSTYIASGSADGVVKVWDIVKGFVTHVFKGHGGVVSALKFSFPQDPSSVTQGRTMQLITASVDTRIRIFDLMSRHEGASQPEAVLEGHVSVPRGLDISPDGKWLVSGGRDSVVLIWDLSVKSSKKSKRRKEGQSGPTLSKTIPILERVEAVGLLAEEDSPGSTDGIRFYTAGEKGVIKIWDGPKGDVLFTLGGEQSTDDQEEQRQIVDAM
jgi:U3 small nucleolar RNA-associated protein 13